MKKHFSDEQIISILRETKAGVSGRELDRKHITFYARCKSFAVWKCRKLSVLRLSKKVTPT